MKLGCLLLAILPLNLLAQGHREHGAHQHGGGVLSIAFENSPNNKASEQVTGKIEFRAAAAGILGFEHVAKSEQDKKVLATQIEHFDKQIGLMVQMDHQLHCQITKGSIGLASEKVHQGSGHHSDFVAHFDVTCAKSPLGTKMLLDFTSLKRMKEIEVVVLVGDLQKSVEMKSKPVQIDLK